LGEAAEKLGVGFQILDDVKNITSGIPGKKRGDDIVEGKKSLPVLLFLHRQPEKREMVFRCFKAARSGGVKAPEVEELIQALSAAGVPAEAEERGKTLIAEARAAFATSELTTEGRTLLSGLCDLIA
jgi:octaprenyl-diphosphate synthase